MKFIVAVKAFFKALKDPKKAQLFLEDNEPAQESADASHLRLLSVLQQSGRLVDFLKEDISKFNDAQVGAAARKIHQDCSKALEEVVTIRPVMVESEGAKVQVSPGYDPTAIKVIGKVKGEPPYKGTLVHKGWKAAKRSLPKKIGEQQSDILHPAEIEVV
jgi:hypothetical protein